MVLPNGIENRYTTPTATVVGFNIGAAKCQVDQLLVTMGRAFNLGVKKWHGYHFIWVA